MGKASRNARPKKEVPPVTPEQWIQICEHARKAKHKSPPIIEDAKQIPTNQKPKERK